MAIKAAQQHGKSAVCQINLGYIWGLFHSFVPPILQRFRQRCPETPVHLFDLSPLDQAKALQDGRLDAGFIGFAHEADAAGLHKQKVGTSTFVVALPKAHRAARKSTVALANLADDFFFGISAQTYPGASHYVTRACERAGFKPKILQMVERGYTILGLVASNRGVALLPESLKALPHPGIVFRPLKEPPIADLYIAWRAKIPQPPLSKLLYILQAAG
jgi:DNA-binding transcriptional LysR family regulator